MLFPSFVFLFMKQTINNYILKLFNYYILQEKIVVNTCKHWKTNMHILYNNVIVMG